MTCAVTRTHTLESDTTCVADFSPYTGLSDVCELHLKVSNICSLDIGFVDSYSFLCVNMSLIPA